MLPPYHSKNYLARQGVESFLYTKNMHTKPHRHKHFLRRHIILIIALVLLVGGTAMGLSWYTNQQTLSVEKQKSETSRVIAQLDKDIVKLKEARAAKLAEEERIRKEAEAKATADQVIKTSEANAASINSASCNVSKSHTDPNSVHVIVNKKHCLQPITFVPGDLVTVYGATLSNKAAGSFKAMYEAAAAAGQQFSVTSSYRSYSNQVSTYAYWVSTSGAAGADTYSARPGYSEHQTGLAVDVASGDGTCSLDCFGKTSQYAWLQANAAQYGFIQRYYATFDSITGYKAEEWHYRYVGRDLAVDMQAKGIKTLEQYWNLPGGTY